MAWLAANLVNIIICAVIAVLVVTVIIKLVKNLKAGKPSCGCSCDDCKGCSLKSDHGSEEKEKN